MYKNKLKKLIIVSAIGFAYIAYNHTNETSIESNQDKKSIENFVENENLFTVDFEQNEFNDTYFDDTKILLKKEYENYRVISNFTENGKLVETISLDFENLNYNKDDSYVSIFNYKYHNFDTGLKENSVASTTINTNANANDPIDVFNELDRFKHNQSAIYMSNTIENADLSNYTNNYILDNKVESPYTEVDFYTGNNFNNINVEIPSINESLQLNNEEKSEITIGYDENQVHIGGNQDFHKAYINEQTSEIENIESDSNEVKNNANLSSDGTISSNASATYVDRKYKNNAKQISKNNK